MKLAALPLVAVAIVSGGCTTAPDAAERQRRYDAEQYVVLPAETGSRINRRVKASELDNRPSTVGASPVSIIGGQTMRDTKATLADAIGGP